MCSVLHNPIPFAPNFFAVSASFGVSAFVLISKRLYSSAHFINVSKFPDTVAGFVLICLSYTLPVPPSIDI